MVGCRYGAKNTLVKNYLWFAERRGVQVLPERQVTEIRPLGAADGSDGYAVDQRALRRLAAPARAHADGARRGRRRRRPRHQQAARRLPARRRAAAALRPPRRRWSAPTRESIQAVTAPDDSRDFTRSVAITSSIYPDPDTHIEVVTYGQAGDAMSRLFTAMTGAGHPS